LTLRRCTLRNFPALWAFKMGHFQPPREPACTALNDRRQAPQPQGAGAIPVPLPYVLNSRGSLPCGPSTMSGLRRPFPTQLTPAGASAQISARGPLRATLCARPSARGPLGNGLLVAVAGSRCLTSINSDMGASLALPGHQAGSRQAESRSAALGERQRTCDKRSDSLQSRMGDLSSRRINERAQCLEYLGGVLQVAVRPYCPAAARESGAEKSRLRAIAYVWRSAASGPPASRELPIPSA
jgi:hypothetical protein